MLHILEHAILDSINVFVLVFVLYFILSFIEKQINKKLGSNNRLSPLFGAFVGLVPQCGISVAASDLYIKRRITIGTLIAVFLACSDEAIFILLASDKFLTVIPLLLSKLLIGFISGYLLDSILVKKNKTKNEEIDVECCHHHHHKKENKILDNFVHTLSHSFEVFIYVLIVNILFGILIYFIGENNIILFLEKNKYLAPLFSTIIGVIPNCATSIILSELYIIGGISFGSLLAGLLINAGLGMIYLFKERQNLKENLIILFGLFIVSIFIGYLICFINGF